RAAGVDGIRSRPRATDPAAPGGAQPQRGSARVPRGPAIPAARARRLRRRALSGAYHDFEDGTLVRRRAATAPTPPLGGAGGSPRSSRGQSTVGYTASDVDHACRRSPPMSLPKPVETLWKELEAVRAEVLREVEGLGQRQADWKPSAKDWSVGEIVDHLTVAEIATLDPRQRRFKHAHRGDLDLAQWWELQRRHDAIHLAQIRDVKRAPGFPKA